MTPVRIRPARPDETGRLFDIWHSAVAATHDFLPADALAEIAAIVRDRYLPAAALWVAADRGDRALGFLGAGEGRIDALFVDPAVHRRGVGRALADHARALQGAGPIEVDVNEQNPGAVAFYLRLGFRRIGRSPLDEDGRPFPLLHLRRDG